MPITLIWSVLSGGLMKFATAAFAWLKTIPWDIVVIALMTIALFVADHRIRARDATIAKDEATYRSNIVLWQHANAVNMTSVQTLLGAVRVQNRAVAVYVARARAASLRASQAFAVAAKAQASRDRAMATLTAAPAVLNDCDAPAAHDEVEDEL